MGQTSSHPRHNMKLLLLIGLVAVSQAVPQRFRQRGLPRQGRQETGYLAPAPDSYVTPPADAPALYSAPEEAAAELDNRYLAPDGSDDYADYAADYSAPEADSSYLAPAPSDEVPVYEAEETLDTYTEPLDTEDLDGYND